MNREGRSFLVLLEGTYNVRTFLKMNTLWKAVVFFRSELMPTLWSVPENSTTPFYVALKGCAPEGKGHRVP